MSWNLRAIYWANATQRQGTWQLAVANRLEAGRWPNRGGALQFLVKVLQEARSREGREVKLYTLPETNIAMENPPFWWYLPGKMGIFMGYVSFREGTNKPTFFVWKIWGWLRSFFFRWQMLEAKCYNEDTFTKNLRTLSACPWVSGTETVGNLCELSTATCKKSYLRSSPGWQLKYFLYSPPGKWFPIWPYFSDVLEPPPIRSRSCSCFVDLTKKKSKCTSLLHLGPVQLSFIKQLITVSVQILMT